MYNNPFMYQNLYRPSIFSRLFRTNGLGMAGAGINWGNILSNTQKGLGIINQAIPLVNQVKPIINNAKTMFKIADIIRDDNKVSTTKATTSQNTNSSYSKHTEDSNQNKPIFFI